jgi:hypothetical protein
MRNPSHFVLLALALFSIVIPLHAQISPLTTPPDSTLYTTYTLSSSNGETTVGWAVCGSTQDSEGCYAAGGLGPFVAVGGILEGSPGFNGNVVTRAIFVVDSGTVSPKLYVYKKVDTVTSESDTVTVTLFRTITLPLNGGSTAACYMAANAQFLFIGTSLSEQAAMVQKSNLNVTQVGAVPGNVVAITSDQYGYVTITNQDSVSPPIFDFTVIGPDGLLQEDGGGSEFMVGTTQAVPLTNVGGAAIRTAPRIGYAPKASLETHKN